MSFKNVEVIIMRVNELLGRFPSLGPPALHTENEQVPEDRLASPRWRKAMGHSQVLF